MKKHLIVIFIILFLVLFSCQEKVTKYYYDSGELQTEEYLIKGNDSVIYVKQYYKNGTIKQEGMVKYDSIMDGHWKIYYADGKLMWEGEMKSSVIQDNCKWEWEKCVANIFKEIEIEGNHKELIVGDTYKFRVIMPEIHPKFYEIVNVNYRSIFNIEEDTYLYPYVFTCAEEDGNLFRMVFMNKDGTFIIGNPEYVFFITPSKKNKITGIEELEVGDTINVEIERTYSDGAIDTVMVYK